jgi:hypothetical protein
MIIRNKGILLIIGILVLSILIISAFLFTKMLKGERNFDSEVRENMVIEVISRLSDYFGVEFHEDGIAQHLWGSARVFNGISEDGKKVIIELGQESNQVWSVESYGFYPAKKIIDRSLALAAANHFIEEYAPDIDLTDMQFNQSSPDKDSIQVYRFEWQKIASSGAILPHRIVVYVDAENGLVSDYFHIKMDVTVSTEPTIDWKRAIDVCENVLYRTDVVAKCIDPILVIIPDETIAEGQRLVWVLTISSVNPQIPFEPFLLTMFVDAQNEEILDLDQ